MFGKKKKKEQLISFENEQQENVVMDNNDDLQEDFEAIPENSPLKTQKKKTKKSKKEKKIKPNKNGEPKEPFFKNKKSVGLLFIILSLIAMICIPFTNYYLGLSEVTVFVAKDNLYSSAVPITADEISSVKIKKSSMLPVYVTDKDNIIGSYVKSDFAKGEIISDTKISKIIPFENNYLYDLQGKKAISVTTKNLASSVAGKLQSGDIVSIYFFDEDKAKETNSSNGEIAPELVYVEVLAVTNQLGEDIDENNKENLEEPLPSCVTLLVDDLQAKALVGLEENYTIHFALVNRGNVEKSQELLEIQQNIINSKGDTSNNE
ncbi:MAG: Flp pilus assembly protein CpaB [Oscillospiraceae bacterium]